MTHNRQDQSKNRSDLIAAICGVLAIPIFLVLFDQRHLGSNSATSLLASLTLLASVSASVASILQTRHLPRELSPAAGARSGARASLICVVTGGASLSLYGTLLSLGALGSAVPAMPGTLLLLGIVGMTTLPVLLAGIVAGWGTAIMRNSRFPNGTHPGEPLEFPLDSAEPSSERSRWRTAKPYLLIISTLCYLSPLATLFPTNEDPTSENPSSETASAPQTETSPRKEEFSEPESKQPEPVQPPPPPPYKYERPEGFLEATANAIALIERKRIGGIIGDAPVVLSPDGKQVAFFRKRFTGLFLVVLRLSDRKELKKFQANAGAVDLAWSQDGSKIVYLSSSTPRHVGVLDLDRDSNTALPIPFGAHLPSKASLVWPFEKQIFLLSSQGKEAYLDLDTLRIRPLHTLQAWTNLDSEAQSRFRAQADGPHYLSGRWNIRPVSTVSTYQPPSFFRQSWKLAMESTLAIQDLKLSYLRVLPIAPLQRDQRLIATPDQSIFLRIGERDAEVLYFGLREKSNTVGRLKKTAFSSEDSEADIPEELRNHLARKTLSAFICSSLVNPLTGEVVGPDRNRVRGLARLSTDEEGNIQFWINEEFTPLRNADVLTDLHYWSSGNPQSLKLPSLESWWTPVPDSLLPELPPAREVTPDRTDRIHASSASPTRPDPRNPEPPKTTEDRIRAFIADHHQKVTDRDIRGFAQNYAPKVDFFDHGVVTRKFIETDQRKYQSKFKTVTETLKGPIKFREDDGTHFLTEYDLQSFIQGAEKWNWQRITSRVTLGLRIKGNSISIIYQRSKVTDTEHGEP